MILCGTEKDALDEDAHDSLSVIRPKLLFIQFLGELQSRSHIISLLNIIWILTITSQQYRQH